MIIRLRRAACDDITCSQRDPLLSFEKFDRSLCERVMKYFLKHASNCLCRKNVVLSFCTERPLLAIDAVKTSIDYRRSKNFYFVAIPTKR